MTKLEQAAQALLAHWDTPAWKYLKPTGDLIADLREALSKQAEQEPVAERFEKMHANGDVWITTLAAAAIARKAAPVRTKDLTDDEIRDAVSHPMTMMKLNDARAVVAADRKKNHA